MKLEIGIGYALNTARRNIITSGQTFSGNNNFLDTIKLFEIIMIHKSLVTKYFIWNIHK